MSDAAQLQMEGLHVAFDSPRGSTHGTVLRDFDLRVGRHRFLAIVGPSGCGKTTLLRVLAGLQPTTSGSIRFEGQSVPNIASHAAMVFQTPNLLPWRTVVRNMALGLELRRRPQAEIAGRVEQLLHLTGLSPHASKRPFELSGGMQQRVNLARALAVRPSVLLMDEPFSALDTILRERLQADLQAIWLREPCLVLFVTHQLDEALWLADEVVVMGGPGGCVTLRIEVDLPRPRTRDGASIARLASLQSTLRDHLEQTGAYALA